MCPIDIPENLIPPVVVPDKFWRTSVTVSAPFIEGAPEMSDAFVVFELIPYHSQTGVQVGEKKSVTISGLIGKMQAGDAELLAASAAIDAVIAKALAGGYE